MKLAFITPTAYLTKYSTQGDIYLALAHLVDNEGKNEYATFHRRQAEKGRRVILDNGLFEGAQVPTDTLLRRARAIKASVVCAPDVLYNSAETIKAFKQFNKAKQEFGLVAEVMGIPQADNPVDWWECFRFMELSSECDLIGLSILSIPRSFEQLAKRQYTDAQFERITHSRVYFLQQLYAYEKLVGRAITPCHLLGLGESYADITYSQRYLRHTVLSNDSSSAFVHGQNGVQYSKMGTWKGGKISEKLNFDLIPLIFPTYEKRRQRNIQNNIDVAKRIACQSLLSR